MSQPEPDGRTATVGNFEVDVRTHGRTALVELRGELDLATVSQVAQVVNGLARDADGVRHVVVDVRGLTFMDASGLQELIRQNDYANQNRYNLAVVRGRDAIERLLALTAVDEVLVLVDDPDDLAPPVASALREPERSWS